MDSIFPSETPRYTIKEVVNILENRTEDKAYEELNKTITKLYDKMAEETRGKWLADYSEMMRQRDMYRNLFKYYKFKSDSLNPNTKYIQTTLKDYNFFRYKLKALKHRIFNKQNPDKKLRGLISCLYKRINKNINKLELHLQFKQCPSDVIFRDFILKSKQPDRMRYIMFQSFPRKSIFLGQNDTTKAKDSTNIDKALKMAEKNQEND